MKTRVKILAVFFLILFTSPLFAATDFFTTLNDGAITVQVFAKVALDKNVRDLQVNLNTENGTVFISGPVNSSFEKNRLIEIASSTSGVKKVDASKLIVKESTQPVADTAITAKVKGLFIQEKLFGKKDIAALGISVETNNGVVYLTGTASNEQQAQNAAMLAKSVSGVNRVKSDIKVVKVTD